jgi:Kef-type K+ transport system membrane component KefB
VPVFLAALLVARGLPALLYVRAVGRAQALAAGFMQATSLTFIVVATIIGVETNHQRSSTATALVVAGLLSVIIYPPIALHLLKKDVGSNESRLPAPAPAADQPGRREEPP